MDHRRGNEVDAQQRVAIDDVQPSVVEAVAQEKQIVREVGKLRKTNRGPLSSEHTLGVFARPRHRPRSVAPFTDARSNERIVHDESRFQRRLRLGDLAFDVQLERISSRQQLMAHGVFLQLREQRRELQADFGIWMTRMCTRIRERMDRR
jgi:hypothetical protein